MTLVLSELDSAVASLRRQGVPLDKAERAARTALGLASPEQLATAERDDRILEKAEQAKICELLRAHGFNPRNLSQARASKQAPGLPDLWVVHRTKPIAFWWESKRQVGGALSPAQEDFRDDCLRTGVGWGSGDRYALVEFLATLPAL